MCTPFDAQLPNLARQPTQGRGSFIGHSHAPLQWRRNPSVPDFQFLGSLIFMRTPFVVELPNLTW